MGNSVVITIKGMVCTRCIIAIRNVLENMGVRIAEVQLGKVMVEKSPDFDMKEVQLAITGLGFEILVEKHERIVNEVKKMVDEYFSGMQDGTIRFSALLSHKTHISYDTVSSIFSSREGITIESYIIQEKLKRVKQLLTETDLTLTDISYQTNYSSVHHLSRQFKEKVGLNPSEYRQAARRELARVQIV